jgi:hypothetical protein
MGRKVLAHSLMATLLLGMAAPAWSQGDNAKAIIEKAIQAQGGADKVAKLKVSHEKARGTFYLAEKEIPFKVEAYQQLPNQARTVITLNAGGMDRTIIEVVNGDKAWQSVNGVTTELDDKELADNKEALHASYVTTLLPLLNDKGFELKGLGEAKVDSKVVVGVKVSFKGRQDVKLYFDKESGLLVKVTRPTREPIAMKPVIQDELFSDYKVVDGVKQPQRVLILHDGKKFMAVEFLEITFVPSFDAKLFARPQ